MRPVQAELRRLVQKGSSKPETKDCGASESYSTPAMVVSMTACHGNHATASTQPIHIHLHGCFTGGLGCSYGGVHSSGDLESSRNRFTHKSVATQRCAVSSKGSNSTLPSAQGGSGGIRQLNSCVVYKQTGRDQVSSVSGPNLEASGVVSCSKNSSSSKAHSRGTQCNHGHSVSKESSSSHRVGSKSGSCVLKHSLQ